MPSCQPAGLEEHEGEDDHLGNSRRNSSRWRNRLILRKTGKFEVGFAPPAVESGLLRASLVWQESKKVGGIWIGGRGASEGAFTLN